MSPVCDYEVLQSLIGSFHIWQKQAAFDAALALSTPTFDEDNSILVFYSLSYFLRQ